jgi:hypothetical protein
MSLNFVGPDRAGWNDWRILPPSGIRLRSATTRDAAFIVDIARHACVIDDWPLLLRSSPAAIGNAVSFDGPTDAAIVAARISLTAAFVPRRCRSWVSAAQQELVEPLVRLAGSLIPRCHISLGYGLWTGERYPTLLDAPPVDRRRWLGPHHGHPPRTGLVGRSAPARQRAHPGERHRRRWAARIMLPRCCGQATRRTGACPWASRGAAGAEQLDGRGEHGFAGLGGLLFAPG